MLLVIQKAVCIVNGVYSDLHKEATVFPTDYVTQPEHIKANMYFTVGVMKETNWKKHDKRDLKCSPELNPGTAVAAPCCVTLSLPGGSDPPPPVTLSQHAVIQ